MWANLQSIRSVVEMRRKRVAKSRVTPRKFRRVRRPNRQGRISFRVYRNADGCRRSKVAKSLEFCQRALSDITRSLSDQKREDCYDFVLMSYHFNLAISLPSPMIYPRQSFSDIVLTTR